MEKQYQQVNGTSYDARTPSNIIHIMEAARKNRTRLRFHWGDVETGKDWGDVYDVAGYVGRSTGFIQIPLLIHNSRSTGGGAIIDHAIVKITESKGKRVLYQHANYHNCADVEKENEQIKKDYPIQDDEWPSRRWNSTYTDYVDMSGC